MVEGDGGEWREIKKVGERFEGLERGVEGGRGMKSNGKRWRLDWVQILIFDYRFMHPSVETWQDRLNPLGYPPALSLRAQYETYYGPFVTGC